MNTKDKIIYQSLNLFSNKGFDAVSVRDIAKEVGIKASSIYNHFANKQDIFDAIINKYSEHVINFLNCLQIYKVDDISTEKKKKLLLENFFNKSVDLFNFYLEDEYIIKFRRLLTIEQYKNSKLTDLYNRIFIDDILDFQAKIFKILIDADFFIKKDPYTLALQFYSPVFLLFYKFERVTDKERTSLKKHILEFRDVNIMRG